MSARDGVGGVRTLGRRQRFENSEITVRIYPGALAEGTIYCPISARKTTTAAEAIERVIERLQLDRTRCYVLAEVKEFGGEEWILNPCDCPVQRMMLWPRVALEQRPLSGGEDYRFLLRQKNLDGSIHYGGSLQMWLQVTEERRRMVERGLLPQPDSQGDHADLCHLPELNERSLLDNLRSRFLQEKIYTYVGSILIVINPFKFLPIYNPKYVKMYDNHALGKLEPHIYAVADVAYHTMLQRERNQCIVISGESGSGKTQSTNFLIHHLTALSQKGFASGVEQIILGAGPVLEVSGLALAFVVFMQDLMGFLRCLSFSILWALVNLFSVSVSFRPFKITVVDSCFCEACTVEILSQGRARRGPAQGCEGTGCFRIVHDIPLIFFSSEPCRLNVSQSGLSQVPNCAFLSRVSLMLIISQRLRKSLQLYAQSSHLCSQCLLII